MQVFVRGLDARSHAFLIDPNSRVVELKRQIEETQGIPSCSQGLVYAGRQLDDERSPQSYGICAESTVHLVLRLRGGKGGFGALLRGLGRDGSKTTNDDAMRDLQGRRMRHTNAENKLKEWESKAKERELEKIALQHIKEQERQARREQENKVEVDSIAREQVATVSRVQDAVKDALASSAAAAAAAGPALPAKRAAGGATATAAAAPAAKKPKMLAALESFGCDDEESSSDEDEEE